MTVPVMEYVPRANVTVIRTSQVRTAPSPHVSTAVPAKVTAYPASVSVMTISKVRTAQNSSVTATVEANAFIIKNVYVMKASTANTAKKACARIIAIATGHVSKGGVYANPAGEETTAQLNFALTTAPTTGNAATESANVSSDLKERTAV